MEREIILVAGAQRSGGAERYLIDLYRGLDQIGLPNRLVGTIPGWSGSQTVFPPLEDAKWGDEPLHRSIRKIPRLRSQMASTTETLRPLVFHAQYKREQIVLSRPLSNVAPVVWTEHGRFRSSRKARVMQAAYKNASAAVHTIICVNDLVANDVADVVGGRRNVVVIPNTVDFRRFSPPSVTQKAVAKASFGLSPESRCVLWMGRLDDGKLPQLAIEVARVGHNEVLVAGQGPLTGTMISAARNTSQLNFVGHLDEPVEALHAADAFLFTSTGAGEGMPLAVLEAIAVGLPVVAAAGHELNRELAKLGAIIARPNATDLTEALDGVILEGRAGKDIPIPLMSRDDWLRAHVDILKGS